MAVTSKVAQAGAAAFAARNSPYVQRLVQDPELRDNLRTAFDSARSAYTRVSNGKSPGKAIIEDKRLHKDLQRAADALSASQAALKQGPKKQRRRGSGLGRLLLLLIVGAAVALGVSEGLRNKVLDLVFGAEEEFDYTSTTTPPPPPAPAQPAQSTG